MVRIFIDGGIDHAGDAGIDQSLGAWWSAAVSGARFESHIGGGFCCCMTIAQSIRDCLAFGVWLSRGAMPAAADGDAVFYQDAAYGWIGCGFSDSFSRLVESETHPVCIVTHGCG